MQRRAESSETSGSQKKMPFHSLAISKGASRLSTFHSLDQSRSPTGSSASSSASSPSALVDFLWPALKNLEREATALSRMCFSPAGV